MNHFPVLFPGGIPFQSIQGIIKKMRIYFAKNHLEFELRPLFPLRLYPVQKKENVAFHFVEQGKIIIKFLDVHLPHLRFHIVVRCYQLEPFFEFGKRGVDTFPLKDRNKNTGKNSQQGDNT